MSVEGFHWVPRQPADGSALLDSDGDVWQRQGHLWRLIGDPFPGLPWEDLIREHGEVRIIHDAG